MNLKRLIPHSVKTRYAIRKESSQLKQVPKATCDVSNLKTLTAADLYQIFNSETITSDWNGLTPLREEFKLPNLKGGVNPGDQRAIYHLLKGLEAQSVLEIGTHIGSSTAHISLALRDQPHPKLITVDIKDVNDPHSKPWIALNSQYSPKELVDKVGGSAFVDFKVMPSLDFMRNCQDKFDFIFLDGDHRAFTVYQEIPVALKLLNPGGVILLHDHFPENVPLWSDGKVSPGTFLATQRLKNEGHSLDILPLGELPWGTKLNSNVTSLALVTAANSH